jgi:hypothetical protein
VRIKFWRIPACEVPVDDEDAAVRWLYERWFELDEWIDQQLSRDELPVGRKAVV